MFPYIMVNYASHNISYASIVQNKQHCTLSTHPLWKMYINPPPPKKKCVHPLKDSSSKILPPNVLLPAPQNIQPHLPSMRLHNQLCTPPCHLGKCVPTPYPQENAPNQIVSGFLSAWYISIIYVCSYCSLSAHDPMNESDEELEFEMDPLVESDYSQDTER